MLSQNSEAIHLKLRITHDLKILEGVQVHEKYPKMQYL